MGLNQISTYYDVGMWMFKNNSHVGDRWNFSQQWYEMHKLHLATLETYLIQLSLQCMALTVEVFR